MSKEGCERLSGDLRAVMEYHSAEYDLFYCQVIGVIEVIKMGGTVTGESQACLRLAEAINDILLKHLRNGDVSRCDAVGLLEMMKSDILIEAQESESCPDQDQDEDEDDLE